MTLTDPNAEPANCVQCGRDASNGYYDSHTENYYCTDGCFNDWADRHTEVVTEFYRRMNLE